MKKNKTAKQIIMSALILSSISLIIEEISYNHKQRPQNISVNELENHHNPAIAGKKIKITTNGQKIQAQYDDKFYNVLLDSNIRNQLNQVMAGVEKCYRADIFERLSDREYKTALEALVVYDYTTAEKQTAIHYCNAHYKIPNYKNLFLKTFGTINKESKETLLRLWGSDVFNCVQTAFVIKHDFEVMDENFIEFKTEMAKYGIKNTTKEMFCRFINDVPEAIVEQQLEVFKIQHPDYTIFLAK